jgi:hypothetical protein
MKNKKYHTVRTVPKSIRKIVERGKIDITNTQIHDCLFLLLQKYGAAAIFFLYGNKNIPSAEILRGRRCLRIRTFILFGPMFIEVPISSQES